ncbi:calcium and calcium/calmodulin-dependent serine/threonine-protein kinase [Podospora conica]|nr:calcium and calcium/calmodulin-dependent serine/threonine-protein kinase [Schizothecium conicum]
MGTSSPSPKKAQRAPKRSRRGPVFAGQQSPRAVQASPQQTEGTADMDLDNQQVDASPILQQQQQQRVPIPAIEVRAGTQDNTGDDIVLNDPVPGSDYKNHVRNRNPQTRSRIGIDDETFQNLVQNKKLLLSQWSSSSELGDDSEGQHISSVAESITPNDYGGVPDDDLVETVRADLEPLVVSNFNNVETRFLPWTVLHKVLSTDTALRILRHLNKTANDGKRHDHDLREMAGRVAPPLASLKTGYDMGEQFRRVFGTLILVGHEKLVGYSKMLKHEEDIFAFYDNGVNDKRLLTDVRFNGHEPASSRRTNDLFFNWSARKIIQFKEYRWKLSPKLIAVKDVKVSGSSTGEGRDGVIFAKRMQYKLLSTEEILPFTATGRPRDAGGFGGVRFFILHEDQQAIPRYTWHGRKNPIAVKTLKNDVKGTNQQKMAYVDEVYMMDRLRSSTNTPHITKLLATIEVPGEHSGSGRTDYHLILEAADRNLEQLWRDYKWWDEFPGRGMPDLDLHRWVASQCYGLTDALWRLHDFRPREGDMNQKNHGLHCDIKPDNILHYERWKEDETAEPRGTVHAELGVLQLGDFGLSSFHSTRSVDNHHIAGAFLDYAAPETDIVLTHSPAADVWHLGCLFIDFATWLLDGPRGYERFLARRVTSVLRGKRGRFATFTPTTRDGRRPSSDPSSQEGSPANQEDCTRVDVNPKVLQHATYLCEHPNSTPFVRELIHLAVNYMLVMRDTDQKQIDVEYSQIPTEVKDRLTSKKACEILKGFMAKPDDYFQPPVVQDDVTPFDADCWKRSSLVFQYSVQTLRIISKRVKSGLGPEEAGLIRPGLRVVKP